MTDKSIEDIDTELKALADNPRRRAFVFGNIIEICKNPENQVLYFGPSVNDAIIIAFMLCALDIPAACVSGKTRRPERRRIIHEFHNKTVRVLCNCEVLTTGFDAPLVTHVVIARPTVSHVLFEQMVGRGLRGKEFGGTEVCDVTNFVDNLDALPQVRLGYLAWREIWGLDEQDAVAGNTA